MIIPDFYIWRRKNGWAQTCMIIPDFYIMLYAVLAGTEMKNKKNIFINKLRHKWICHQYRDGLYGNIELIKLNMIDWIIVGWFSSSRKYFIHILEEQILYSFTEPILTMRMAAKSGIILRVWAQSFFLVHVQKSGLILCVSAQSFFLVYVQKSGIIMCLWAQPFFLVQSANRNEYPWFLHMYKEEWLNTNPYDYPWFLLMDKEEWPRTNPYD
jgi:hypothetical protein